MHLTSCGTLVILITSFGEFLLYFIVIFFIFFSFHIYIYIYIYIYIKQCCRIVSVLFLCCPVFAAGIHSQWIRNLEGRLLKVNLPQELGLILN